MVGMTRGLGAVIGWSWLPGLLGNPHRILLKSEPMNGGNSPCCLLNGTHVYWVPKQGILSREKEGRSWNPNCQRISQSSQETGTSPLFYRREFDIKDGYLSKCQGRKASSEFRQKVVDSGGTCHT